MKRRTHKLICLFVLSLGLAVQGLVRPPAAVVADPFDQEAPGGVSAEDFVLDFRPARGHLNRLRIDERPEQIADWAVQATLVQGRVDQKVLREVLHDRPPYRLPTLEEIEPFDYGSGRRVLLPDGGVWLFYEQGDSRRDATLARQADRVTMETGERPGYFIVFRYEVDLAQGKVRVRREEKIKDQEMFSRRYGYVEERVTTAAELARWLAQVDDVAHVGLAGDAVVLGGRRFASARTASVTLDDIAALYQAHTQLKAQQEALSARSRQRSETVIDAFNQLVSSYNSRGHLIDPEAITKNLADPALRRRFMDALKRNSLPLGVGSNFDRELVALERLLGTSAPEPMSDTEKIEWLRERVQRRAERLQEEFAEAVVQNGEVPPPEPGFSLDSRWDVDRLRADLTLLLDKPQVLVGRLLGQAAQLHGVVYDNAATPMRAEALRELAARFGSGTGGFQLSAGHRDKIQGILLALDGQRGHRKEAAAIVPLLALQQSLVPEAAKAQATATFAQPGRHRSPGLRPVPPPDAFGEVTGLIAILKVLATEHGSQCARYDGPLQGTRVGMNLFYTDLLAKLWAGLDYYRSAPRTQVTGFLTMPVAASRLESNYSEESNRYSFTRLWFGPLPDALKTTGDDLNFAPISTRVYSAGSNPLQPGKETQPAELSRRVLGWWDRHFAQVAEYEPQYHVQNQIMKWSIISGKLAAKGLLTDLGEVPVDHSQRFDRWYPSTKELRFHGDIHFRPQERWLGETECLETLASYGFEEAGRPRQISGGVSLGGKSTLAGQAIRPEISPTLRRGGTNYEASSPMRLENWRKTLFDLPSDHPEVVNLQPSPDARMRSGGAEILQRLPIETTIKAEAGSGRISLRTPAGTLLEATFARAQGGLKLNLSLGSEGADQAMMATMAERGPGPSSRAPDAALPAPGRYLVDGKNGPTLLVSPSAGGAGGGAGSPPRKINFAPAEGPEPGAFSVTGGKHVVQKAVLEGAAVATLLKEQPYQVVQAEGPVGQPGVLITQFTKQAPGDGVKARIIIPQIGVISATIKDNKIFMDRPADEQVQQSFNDLGPRGLLTAWDVKRIVARARRSPGKTLEYSTATDRSPEELATIGLEKGDPREFLDGLRQANTKGVLEQALAQANRAVETVRRSMARRLHADGGEEQNTVGAQGGVPGPGPNIGDAHDPAYASWQAQDFREQLGLRLEKEILSEAGAIPKNGGDGNRATGSRDQTSRGFGGSEGSGLPPASTGAQQNSLGLVVPAESSGCADLDHNGLVDAQESALCRQCRDHGGDLDGDGKMDGQESAQCGCQDLNRDDVVDDYERTMCGLCLRTRGDLNGDGLLDGGEVVTCSPVK